MVIAAAVTAALALVLNGLVNGWPPYWERLPGPFQVAGAERSVGPEQIASADWALAVLGPGNRFATDEGDLPVLGSYGDQETVRDDGPLYTSPTLTPAAAQLIRAQSIGYVLVDLRLSEMLPASGQYFPVDPDAGTYKHPLPRAGLAKFNRCLASPASTTAGTSSSTTWRDLPTMGRSQADVTGTALAAVLACAAAAAGAPAAVTTVLGIALFAAPGYLLGQLLVGSRTAGLERVAVMTALALAVPVLGGLLLNVAGIPLHRPGWLGLLAGVTLAADTALFARRRAAGAGRADRAAMKVPPATEILPVTQVSPATRVLPATRVQTRPARRHPAGRGRAGARHAGTWRSSRPPSWSPRPRRAWPRSARPGSRSPASPSCGCPRGTRARAR